MVGQVEYNDAPQRLTKGVARHPVPIMLLARLAGAIPWPGKGLGSGLLRDAMLRTLQAAFGVARAVVVTFPNPLLDRESASTVYIARKAPACSRGPACAGLEFVD